MHTFLIALHVFLCLVLIGVILLQPGKDGAASLGGGGGNQGFSPRGQGNALSQATTVVAVMFMGTSITLAWLGTETDEAGDELQEDILRLQEEASKINAVETPKEAAPAAPPAEAAPAMGAPAAAPAEAAPVVAPEAPAVAPEAPKNSP
jgi:preprotein translocase subunit SecG